MKYTNESKLRYFRLSKEAKYIYSDMPSIGYIISEKDNKEFSLIDEITKIDKESESPEQFLEKAKEAINNFNEIIAERFGKVVSLRVKSDVSKSKKHPNKNFVIIRRVNWKKFKDSLKNTASEETEIKIKYDYITECEISIIKTLISRDENKTDYIERIRETVIKFTKDDKKEIDNELTELNKIYRRLAKKGLNLLIVCLKFQLSELERTINNYEFISAYSELRKILITFCKTFLALNQKLEEKNYRDINILDETAQGLKKLEDLKNNLIKISEFEHKNGYDAREDNYLHLRFYKEYSDIFVHQSVCVVPSLSVYEVLIFRHEIEKFVQTIKILLNYYLTN